MFIIELIKTIFLGIVEGITEWLPISSTGHMILVDEFITLDVSAEFMDLFLFVIQIGAILAVPICFWNKINPFSRKKTEAERLKVWIMWSKVVVGVIPGGVFGLLLEDFFETHFFNWFVVAMALIIFGIGFIIIEKKNKNKNFRVVSVEELTYMDALKMGFFQVLAIVPGTSRSGATIIGGMLNGVSRSVCAEFSFYMAMPIMFGTSGIKFLKFLYRGYSASIEEITLLVVGMIVAFVVSLFVIQFLMDFVKRRDFKPFGIYRIVLGVLVILYFGIRALI